MLLLNTSSVRFAARPAPGRGFGGNGLSRFVQSRIGIFAQQIGMNRNFLLAF